MVKNKSQHEPVILSAVRTPIGRFLGTLSSLTATQLGAAAVRAAVQRAGLDGKAAFDEVIMGNVVSAGAGQAPARQAGIFAGLDPAIGATTVNKVCGSGLKAVMLASQAIKAEDGHLFVAGGMESMSKAPFLVEGRGGLRYGNTQLIDAIVQDGLRDPFEEWLMGDAAEFIAEEYEVTRYAMDEYALKSHQKALAAMDSGKFKQEIVPVEVKDKKGKVSVVESDESPRRDTSLELLAKLPAAFKPEGKVTAGNSPGLNDGASAVVVASRQKADELGRKPLARVVGYAQAAVDPKHIFIAPARAIPVLLEKVGWSLQDVDLIELNEAYAAQVLADGYALADQGWDWDKVNVHGGAIALGHPLGASGARTLTTLIFALKDRGLTGVLAAGRLTGAGIEVIRER